MEFGVEGLWFRVWGLEFRVSGFGFRVQVLAMVQGVNGVRRVASDDFGLRANTQGFDFQVSGLDSKFRGDEVRNKGCGSK